MLRMKDFYLKKVYKNNGKNIGLVEDIYIDFFNRKIKAFKLLNAGIFNKKNYISVENIIWLGEDILVKDVEENSGLSFKEIKGMEVIDTSGKLKGTLEDLVIENFCIRAIIVTGGFIDKMINGKQIILLSECILGEKYILYTGKNNTSLKIIPHWMNKINVKKEA